MSGLCLCGCGLPTPIAWRSITTRNIVRGQSLRFINGHQSRGANNGHWHGGRGHNGKYIQLWNPSHVHANAVGYVFEHIVIAAQALGHPLPVGAEVHHVDRNGKNNANRNLVICDNHAYHGLLHRRTTAYRATGNAHAVQCRFCKQWGTTDEGDMRTVRHGVRQAGESYHRICSAAAAMAQRKKRA